MWIGAMLLDYLWGIETLRPGTGLYSLNNVTRLPMRNWNTVPQDIRTEIKEVTRLPMRNWNKTYSFSFAFSLFLLLDYLWGIETQSGLALWQ